MNHHRVCGAWKSAVFLAVALLVIGPFTVQQLQAGMPVALREAVFSPFQPNEALMERFQLLGDKMGWEITPFPDGSAAGEFENVAFFGNPLNVSPSQISSNGAVSVVADEGTLSGSFSSTMDVSGSGATIVLESDWGGKWVLTIRTSPSGDLFSQSVMYFDPMTGSWSTATVSGTVDSEANLTIDGDAVEEAEAVLDSLMPYVQFPDALLRTASAGLVFAAIILIIVIILAGVAWYCFFSVFCDTSIRRKEVFPWKLQPVLVA